jgi:hypothetical protein
VTGEVVKNPTKSTLQENNEMTYLAEGRNVQSDYYRLENRQRQLDLLKDVENNQLQYILGVDGGSQADNSLKVKKAIQRIHEQDLLELKGLVYLQSLPDTSPEYTALKTMTGGHNRESIARMLAEKQMKKLYMSQVEKILATDKLADVYKTEIKKGAAAFETLWK